MEAVCERGNLRLAYQRVMENKGAAGVDGIGVVGFKDHLKQHWPTIKARILGGTYKPQPVRRVDIPKPQGGIRTLGIPTLTDRLIQQALHQVLSPIFEADFSGSSYGFRRGRNAHQAVKAARSMLPKAADLWWIMDLEKFFDRVPRHSDGEAIEEDRRWSGNEAHPPVFGSGMMAGDRLPKNGGWHAAGGPLSPLLSNILLSELDRELERRGHAFCRYADDCNIYVEANGQGSGSWRTLPGSCRTRSSSRSIWPRARSRPWNRKFLGYSLTWHKAPRLRIATTSLKGWKTSAKCPRGEGTQPEHVHIRTQPDSSRLDGLLSADPDQEGFGRVGWMDQAQATLHFVAAVEASVHACQELDEGGIEGGARLLLGLQPAGALVEQWRKPHEPGLPKIFL